jgi:hypothetical protein
MNSVRRIGLVVAICAFAGALAGIAGTMAAPSSHKSSKSSSSARSALEQKRAFGMRMRMRGRPGIAKAFGFGFGFGFGGPVHSETVIPNDKGDGFITVTTDSGKLKSIDGTKLTVTEGTDKKTYAEPTIDVGSDARVIRNGKKATLSDLKEDDFVHILKGGPKGTIVFAEDAAFRAQQEKMRKHFERGFRHDHHKFGPGGFPGPPPPGPPPPGAPGPGGYPGDEDSSGGDNS